MEAFVSEHNVTFDEVLYEWPASRFEALYEAYARRKVADELSHRRSLEMAAMWGNTNLDQKEHPELRQEWMKKIDESYSIAIARLYGEIVDEEAEIDEDDPFYQAMRRGLEKRGLPQPQFNQGGEN